MLSWLSSKMRFFYFRARSNVLLWVSCVRQIASCLLFDRNAIFRMTLILTRIIAIFFVVIAASVLFDGITVKKIAYLVDLLGLICIAIGLVSVIEINFMNRQRGFHLLIDHKKMLKISIVNCINALLRMLDFTSLLDNEIYWYFGIILVHLGMVIYVFSGVMLIVSESPWTLLTQALFTNNNREAELAIEHLGDVNRRDRRHMYPLGQAISFGKYEMVGYLLDKGADPFLPMYNDLSILEWSKLISSDAYDYIVQRTQAKEEVVVLDAVIDDDVNNKPARIEF